MDYEVIFYRSGKTSEIQNLLSDKLSDISLSLNEVYAAVSPKELTDTLSRSVKRSRLIFIAGDDTGKQGTANLLNKILRSDKTDISLKELKNGDDTVCCIKRSGEQTIVVLPDDTENIKSVLPELKSNLSDIYDLEQKDDDTPIPEVIAEDITENIDKQMSQVKRVRVTPSGNTAEKRANSILSSLKTTIAILLILAALQIGAALYLFLTQ